MTLLRSYYLSIVAAALLCSVSSQLIKQESSRNVLHFVGTLLMVLTILCPLLRIEGEDMARAIAKLHLEAEQIRADVVISNRDLQAEIIKRECETYIWDKANEMGMEITPEIVLKDDMGIPYPYRVVIKGKLSDTDQQRLSSIISQDLAIPMIRQEWRQD